MVTIFGTSGAIALALLVSGPALKGRFDLSDIIAYIIPTLIFAFSAGVLNVLSPLGMPKRIALGLLMLLPLAASTVGFMVGYAGEGGTMIMIAINCIIAGLVVFFPWNQKFFNVLIGTFAVVGIVLSLHVLLTFNTAFDQSDAVEIINEGRLSVSFVIGLGAIAALYFVVHSFSPVALAALGLCWIGMALTLSRGPVLFCAVASFGYLVVVFRSNKIRFGAGKKFLVVAAVAAMIPIFMRELMSVSMNERRFTRVFDFEAELQDGGRGAIWLESFMHFSESPLVGNGLGAATADGSTPHNLFLQYAEDSGLIGVGIMVLLFAIIGLRILKSFRISNGSSMNMVLAAGAMFVYMLMNFQKSFDSYKNRESFILCALPLAMYAYLSIADNVHGVVRKSKRRRRRLATAIAINEVRKSERNRPSGLLDGKSAPANSR